MTNSSRHAIVQAFAAELRELRLLAGNPSYSDLSRIDAHLARSTMSDALTGKSVPNLELLLRLVTAFKAFALNKRHAVDGSAFSVDIWRELWNELHRNLAGTSVPHPREAQSTPQTVRDVPRQLPRDRGIFIGRDSELAFLDANLRPGTTADHNRGSRIVVIDGPAGIGKTALGVHWAHQRAEEFPDGQLFLDLHGFGPGAQRSPSAGLHYLLRTLSADVASDDIDTLSAALRSATASRQMLLLLDNAFDAGVVRAFLPGSAGSVVLVTSRRRMTTLNILDGARGLSLPLLTQGESVEVLRAGSGLTSESDEQVGALVEICGRLPLALRIAAESVTHLKGAKPEDLLGNSELDDPAVSLQHVFSWSLNALIPSAQEAFTSIGFLPAGAFEAQALASVVERPVSEVRLQLEHMCSVHLVEINERVRYETHDLLRAYAVERINSNFSEDQQTAARRRLCEFYEATAWSAAEILLPSRSRERKVGAPRTPARFANYAAALAWYDDELSSFTEVAEMMRDLGRDDLICDLAQSLVAYFNIRKPWSEWVGVFTLAVAAAERLAENEAIGHAFNGLGIAHRELVEDDQAIACFSRAATAYAAAENPVALGMVENNLGVLANERQNPQRAEIHLARALALLEGVDDPWRSSIVAHNLAEAELALGHLARAGEHASQALELSNEINDAAGSSAALTTMGLISVAAGATEDAIELFRTAADAQIERGERQAAAISQRRLGSTLITAGRRSEGLDALRAAYQTLQDLGDPLALAIRSEYPEITVSD